LSRFQELLPEFEAAQAQVVGMSVDSPFAAAAYARELGVTFPVLGDFPWAPVSRAWGVLNEARGFTKRITFVVGGDGVVRHVVDDARNFQRHAEESLQAAQALGSAG